MRRDHHEGFGIAGGWTVREQNRLLALYFWSSPGEQSVKAGR